MDRKIHLGSVGHFGVAVRDPEKSARRWRERFDLDVMFEGDGYVWLTNETALERALEAPKAPRTSGCGSMTRRLSLGIIRSSEGLKPRFQLAKMSLICSSGAVRTRHASKP